MKKIITQIGFSWKKRLGLSFSIFTGIWVIIRPLGLFGFFEDQLKEIGILGYLGMIILTVFILFCSEYLYRKKQLKKYDFVKLTIELVQEGSRHEILAAYDMKISSFVIKLGDYFERKNNYIILKWHLNVTDTTISVKRNNEYKTLNYDLTLREAELVNDDICRIEHYKKGATDYLLDLIGITEIIGG